MQRIKEKQDRKNGKKIPRIYKDIENIKKKTDIYENI